MKRRADGGIMKQAQCGRGDWKQRNKIGCMSEMEDKLVKQWETNQSLFNVTAQSTIKTKLCAVIVHSVHWIFSLHYICSNFSVVKVLRATKSLCLPFFHCRFWWHPDRLAVNCSRLMLLPHQYVFINPANSGATLHNLAHLP